MNTFDLEILYFLNQFAGQSYAFDGLVKALSINHLFKGGVLVALLWWAWFCQRDEQCDRNRRLILATIVSCAIAETLARALSHSMPFKLRPIYAPDLGLILPYTLQPEAMKLAVENSFPSDHAVLFYSLTASITMISPRAGLFAFVYTTVFIAFPRLYLGLHYTSDILGGALLGVLVTLVGVRWISGLPWIRKIVQASYQHPSRFYPVFFLLSYQIADMFEDCRALLGGVLKLFKTTL